MIIFAVIVVLILAGIGIWFGFFKKEPIEEAMIQEVTVTKEDTSITINREGTMTVRNKYGLFQQQWDDDKVADFFARFEAIDFSRYSQDCAVGLYCLTLTLGDGSTVSYSIPYFDGDLPDVIEEIIEDLEELDDVIPTPTPTPTSGASPTSAPTIRPTVTPTPVPTNPPGYTPIPTPTRGAGGGGGEDLPDYWIPFECDFLDPNLRPDILSETVCTPQ